MCGTLLTDFNHNRPATAQASYSLVRCVLAGGGLAALQALIDAIGVAWTFLVYAGMCLVTIPLLWARQAQGFNWRQREAARQ